MTFFRDIREKNKAAWDALISPEIRELAERRTKISYEEYKLLRCNSYERQEIHRNLDNDCLAHVILDTYANCVKIPQKYGQYLPDTYDESIKLLAVAAAQRLLDNA